MLHKIVLTADDDNNSLTNENDDDNDNDDCGIRNSSSRSSDKDIDVGSSSSSSSSSSSKVGHDGSIDSYDDDDIVNNRHHLSVRVWKDTSSDKPLIEPISYGNACNL